MLLANKKVAIIGAGPVGLTMAKLLQQNGADVIVYERDKHALTRISGGTLDLHKGSGQDAMKKAGLMERYYAVAIPMGRTIADEQGRILFSKKPTPEDQYDDPEINRNDLRKILLDSLTADTVIWDRKFTGLGADNEKWRLHFENAGSETADLVIGANGGMSAVRKYVTDAQIEYTGTIILQGEVPHSEPQCATFHRICNDNIFMVASGGNLLVANPKNGGMLTYNVMFTQPADWGAAKAFHLQDKAVMIAFLLNRFADWHETYKQLFRSTSSFMIWPTRKIGLETPWKNNRLLPVTLIGDAAHIMPPFAGQGVNTGLHDALILSDNLVNGKFDTIASALRDYEQKMFVYATAAQLATSANETTMFLPDFSFLKFYQ